MSEHEAAVVDCREVGLRRGERWTLQHIDWRVQRGERWVVLGPNGSGKTTLVRLIGGHLHPSVGEIDVIGKRIGRTDLRTLRTRIAFASASLGHSFRPTLSALEVVVTGRHAALETHWHSYAEADWSRGASLLARFRVERLADRSFSTLSEGERQRVLLARSLMCEPELILLDEPTAALDLGGREELVRGLTELAADASIPPIVFVTHHVEEIPPAFTHALLLRDGRVHQSGAIDDVMTATNLSSCFGVKLTIERRDGRFSAWASP